MPIPGRSRRARSITPAASSARWRRFIRFRIRSEPACSERCRCGINRGSLSIRRQRSSSMQAGSSDESRNRSSSGTSASSRRASWPRAGLPGRSWPYEVMSTPVSTTSRKPDWPEAGRTRARTCSTTAPIGTERLGPRPNGMMQKVQRWSQPCCTWTKARARPANSVTRWAAVSRACMMSETASPAVRAASDQLPARSFSSLPITLVTPGMALQRAGSIWAAQPVTTMRASGCSRWARRIACRA